MKNILKITAVLTVLIILASCNGRSGGADGSDSSEQKHLTITMVGKSMDNPVFVSAREGAEKAAAAMTEKHRGLLVNIDWKTPEKENAGEQAALIRQAVDAGTGAVIVSCSDDSLLEDVIDYASDHNVPVMTFDSDAPDSRRFAYFGPDDDQIGQRLMDETAERLHGKGNVAILAGNPDAPNLRLRVNGMKTAAEKYPDLNVIGIYHHDETARDAVREMLRINAEHPELNAWTMAGGWPFFSDTLLSVLEPGQYTIVAVDALPEMLPFIESGIVSLFLGQPTFKWGEQCVESVVDRIYLEKDVPESTHMNLIPVTRANLGGWSRQLRAWGFKDLPEKYLTM